MIDLTSARIKIWRAIEHIETLNRDVRKWIESEPHAFRMESNPEGTKHTLIITTRNAPDRDRWGCLFGDAAHNLRSALDHCIWQISTNPDTRGEFPIFDTSVRDDAGNLKRGFERKIEGITNQPVRDFLEACQPYNTQNAKQAALWCVHRIDIVDKHKTKVVLGIENPDVGALTAALTFADDAPLTPPHHFIKHNEAIGDGDTPVLTFLTVGRVDGIQSDFKLAVKVGVDVGPPMDIDIGMPYARIVTILREMGLDVIRVVLVLETLG